MCQAARHGVVREEQNDKDSDKDGEESNDEEHYLPALECFAVIMLKAVAYERSDDTGNTYTSIPYTHTSRLLGGYIQKL